MKIGKVKWFGTYNSYYDSFNNYGFLQQFDGEDIYVHLTGIEQDSSFLQQNRAGEYVVYEITEGRKQDTFMATHVKLLQEIKRKERLVLVQEYKENEEVQKAFRKYFPGMFEKKDITFFIPYLEENTMRTLFEKKCLQGDIEELIEQLREYLEEEPIKKILKKQRPELYDYEHIKLYYYDDMKMYFQNMYSDKTVQELFWNRYSQGYFKTTILRELSMWLQKPDLYSHVKKNTVDILLKKINLEQETEEDILFFIEQAKKNCIFVDRILSVKPNVLFLSKEICKVLDVQDICSIPFGEIVKNTLQIEFLMTYLKPSLQKYVCDQLSQECILSSKDLLERISEKRLCEIIGTIQWKDTSEAYINKWKTVLSFVEADVQENAAVKIAVSMKEQGMLWELAWWKFFTDSVKVRILIYASNFKEERNDWVEALRQIHQLEQEHKNRIILVMLRYFLNMYYRTKCVEKQKDFEQAHNELMNYITDCFTKTIDISHALNTLLEKCQCGYGYKMYFCDARIWENTEKIFCPEGYCRPGVVRENRKAGRMECRFYEDMDLYKTKYQRTKDYKDQFFKDFLMNIGFEPDLHFLEIRQPAEYVHRISAFVNRLIDMRPHMKCQTCGKAFRPNFKYAKLKTAKLAINRYYCLELQNANENIKHDSNVYLNFCYHCESIIDSRECKHRESGSRGQYLCMYCGGTEKIKPGTYCPECGNTSENLLELKGRNRIICKKCGYDALNFVSEFEVVSQGEDDTSQIFAGMQIPEGIDDELPFF